MKYTSNKFQEIVELIFARLMGLDPKLQEAHEVIEATEMPGIYFLVDGETNEILYIGQSRNVKMRLYQHQANARMRSKLDGRWTKTLYSTHIPSEYIRLQYEGALILLVKPPVNQTVCVRSRLHGGFAQVHFGRRRGLVSKRKNK